MTAESSHADIVVIGAGIMGLSTAYHLARERPKLRIVVLDAGYLCGGASGRNGGGIRAQWSNEANIRLMQESLHLFGEFAKEHRINTWLRRGGYLFVARSAAKQRALEQSVAVQNECGLSSRLLTAKEARAVVPELEVRDIALASYNPTDAVVFPWPFVWGYAEGARELGVDIRTFTRVIGFEKRGRGIRRVSTTRGSIDTEAVVNAAGAHSADVAKLLEVDMPNRPQRHEICSSEPLKPWLTPLVADLDDGVYFSQSTRGEIVGGVADPEAQPGTDQSSSVRFLALYARALVRLCPRLASVRVLRQWAGLYDITPDSHPIVGPVDEVEGFFQASGFMGHGFMMAPIIGKLLAQHIAHGTPLPLFERWNLRRFRQGRLLEEKMIIG